MGLGTSLRAQTRVGRPTTNGCPVDRKGPAVRYLSDAGVLAQVAWRRISGRRRTYKASVIRLISDFWCFCSDPQVSDYRRRPVIRWLEDVGHPVLVGRPTAVAFPGWALCLVRPPGVGHTTGAGRPVAVNFRELLLLVLALNILIVLVFECSFSMASL